MIKAIVKYVMNKVINNNTEIRLENKDGDGKTNKKKETGTHEDVSLIKINSTFCSNTDLEKILDQYYLFQISVSPWKTSLTLMKMTWTIYTLNTKAMRSDWWKEYPKGQEM